MSLARARFEILEAKNGGVYFRVKAKNGRIICHSETYRDVRKVRAAIDLVAVLGCSFFTTHIVPFDDPPPGGLLVDKRKKRRNA